MVDHAHDLTRTPRHDYYPVLAFMLGQGLGERGGVEVHGLPGKVPQELHFVDAAVASSGIDHRPLSHGAAAARELWPGPLRLAAWRWRVPARQRPACPHLVASSIALSAEPSHDGARP